MNIFFNIFFLPPEPCQSQLSVETQSQNNPVQSEGQPSKSSEYRAIISKSSLSGAPVYTVKISKNNTFTGA